MDQQGKGITTVECNLGNILENIKDGFWVLSCQGISIYINQRQAERLGKSKEEILNNNIWKLCPELIGTEINKKFKQVFNQQKSINFEYLDTVKQRYYEYRVDPTEQGIAIFTLDITDRKKTEQTQQESIEQFQAFMKYSPASAWIANQEGRLLYLSPTYFRMFQIPQKNVIGKTISEIYSEEFAQQFLNNNQGVFETQQVIKSLESAPRRDGSTGEFLVYKFPIISKLGETLLGGVAVDISEQQAALRKRKQFEESLKAANQRISNILESITDAFVAFDNQWRYTYVNQEASRLLGRSPEDLLGRPWSETFPQVAPQNIQIYEQWQQAVREQISVHYENFCSNINRWLEVSAFPFAEGLAVYFRDISDAKRREAGRQKQEQRQTTHYAITQVLASATTLVDAVPDILQSMCEGLDWQLGIFWRVDHHNILRYVDSWSNPSIKAQDFIEQNQQTTFELGRGLPGRIWQTRQPVWIRELDEDNNFPRAISTAKAGLRAVFGFPILLGHELLGVIECFKTDVQDPDQDLLETMGLIGSQIGQFMERKRTEEALQESQHLFQSFMDHSPIAAYIKDESGRHIYMNAWVKRIFASKGINIIGLTDFEIFPLEAAEEFRRNDLTVLNSGEAMEFLETLPQEDGEHYYMSFKFPVQDACGRQLLAGVSIDVSERIRVEEALRLSDERFRLAARGVNGIVYDWDVQAGTVYRSEGLYALIGVDPNEVSQTRDWWFNRIHPDDLARLQPLMIAVREDGSDRYETEYRVRHQDGRWIEVWDQGYLLRNKNGQLIRVVGLTSDITERKQAEAEKQHLLEQIRTEREFLEAVLQQMPAGVMVAQAPTGNIILTNEQIKQMWRLPTLLPVENIHQSQGEYYSFHPDGRPYQVHEWPLFRSVKTGEVVSEEEMLFLRGDGTWGMMLVNSAPIRDSEGNIKAGVVAFYDISDRKQAEEALRESAERLSLALTAAKMGDWSWNAKTDKVTFSERGAEIFDIPPGPYLTWTQIQNRLHPEDRELARLAVEDAIRDHSDYDIEYRLILPNKTQRWIAAKGRAHYNASGQVLGMFGVVQDISERKQAEETLRQTEARLYVALKNSPITVFNQDQELRYTWIYNPVFNYSVDDIIGKREDELFYQSDVTVLNQIKRSVLESGIGAREEVKINMPDQDYYYDLTVEPLRDPDGKIIGITCAAIDISERKQMELAIHKSETVLNAFLTSSPMAMAFLDQDLRYIYANEALASVNGIPKSEHLGRTVWEVLPQWAPLVQSVVERVLQTKQPLLNQEVTGETNPPGVYRHGLVNYYPVYLPDGEVLGVGLTSMDITELKRAEQALRESEERYRSLVTASSQIVWLANKQGQFVEVQGWEDFTGQPVEQLLAGSTDAIHPEDLERVTQAWWNAVKTQTTYEVEHRIRKSDGTYEYFSIRGVPVFDEYGDIYAWVGMTINIHQRKQAEMEREKLLEWERRAREEAERANRIKDEFLAVLSHELRSPLNPILGWTQMLRTYKLDEKAIQHGLETIERNAKLQTQLIEDLLDISRILRGKMVLNIAPVNLINVIESALETVRLAAEAKNITIQTVLNPSVGEVLGDAARLQQVLWNLLSNAVKFTPTGGQIEVNLDLIDSDAKIQVKDTGKGISQEFLPYVFEYFRQEDSKTTRKFGGLGLGLAIVRHLTELHGGTVQADSLGEGLGAIFTVRIPLTATEPTLIQDDDLPEEVLDLSQLNILVVDDEPDMRELLMMILERYGATVRVATSAAEALSLLEQFSPDVLISDIGMPDVDGYMLMQQIKQLPPERRGLIRAIALTAYAGELNKQKAFQAGFQKHLSKPVEPSELVKTIASLVGKHLTQEKNQDRRNES